MKHLMQDGGQGVLRGGAHVLVGVHAREPRQVAKDEARVGHQLRPEASRLRAHGTRIGTLHSTKKESSAPPLLSTATDGRAGRLAAVEPFPYRPC